MLNDAEENQSFKLELRQQWYCNLTFLVSAYEGTWPALSLIFPLTVYSQCIHHS